MAYAAIISIFTAIKELLDSPCISLTSSTQEILHQAYDLTITWLDKNIDLIWFNEVMARTNEEIVTIEEARSLQDAIESAVSDQLVEHFKSCNTTFSLNLDHLKPDVDRFAHTAEKTKGRIEELWEQKVEMVIEQPVMEVCGLHNKDEEEDVSASSATKMVGLDNEFHKLRDILTGHQHDSLFSQRVTFITGMAGLGKTTLAKRVYNDPMVKANFECSAFVRVGREYWIERLLRSLHAQLNRGDEKMIKEGESLEDIQESLRTTFWNKSCLIVLDDLWDHNVMEYICELCMENLILVTSRQQLHNSPFNSFPLRFLNDDESWGLLKRKVFGKGEVCAWELVEPGKKIAKKCGGLPLLINALAPILLQRAGKNPKSWNRVAKKPSSLLEEASLQISEVLLTSYYRSTINNLRQAEGFDKFLFKLAWFNEKTHVFENLLLDNLVIADQRRLWGQRGVKSCILHCTYWYVNKRVARDNRFSYIMNSYADGMNEHVKSHQRLAIQTNVLVAIKDVLDNITSISTVRSLLCTGPYNQYEVPIYFEWKMLRILDDVTIRFYEFPVEVVKLVLLRYLALSCNANLPPSISKLWNLRFLIVCHHWRIKRVGVESFVPVEIWDLQELTHLEIMGRNMPEPPHPSVVLPNLVKLLDVGVESCSRRVFGNIQKLEKVRIQIELAPDATQDMPCLFDVKSFQCVVMNPTLLRPPPPLSVPILDGIERLSLGGLGYPWEEMSKIAGLPNLRVVKLRNYAFRGEKWELKKQRAFKSLRYLCIEDADLVQWTGSTEQIMKGLEYLKLKNCHKLREIPRLSSYVLTLELIDCNPLAETCAKQIYSGK